MLNCELEKQAPRYTVPYVPSHQPTVSAIIPQIKLGVPLSRICEQLNEVNSNLD